MLHLNNLQVVNISRWMTDRTNTKNVKNNLNVFKPLYEKHQIWVQGQKMMV